MSISAKSKRLIYEGSVEEHFNQFKARYLSDAANVEGSGISVRDFSTENHIGTIIDARTDLIPSTFEVLVKNKGGEVDERLTAEIAEWTEKGVFGMGQNFWERQELWNRTLEVQGDLFPQIYQNDDGEWSVNAIPSDDLRVEIKTDPLNMEKILSVDLLWYAGTTHIKQASSDSENKKNVQLRVVFSEEGVRAEGMPTTDAAKINNSLNGLWQMNHIMRLPRDGSPYGVSAVEELLPAQNEIANAATKLSIASKCAAIKLLAPPASVNIDEWVTQYNADSARARVAPGMIKPYPLEAVGGDSHVAELDALLQKKIDFIYEAARVPRKRDNVDLRSGKAMLMSNAGLRSYIESMSRFRARQWEKFFINYLLLSGKISEGDGYEVFVSYPSFDVKDAEERKATIEAVRQGFIDGKVSGETYLRTLVNEGFLDKDTDVKAELQAAADDSIGFRPLNAPKVEGEKMEPMMEKENGDAS